MNLFILYRFGTTSCCFGILLTLRFTWLRLRLETKLTTPKNNNLKTVIGRRSFSNLTICGVRINFQEITTARFMQWISAQVMLTRFRPWNFQPVERSTGFISPLTKDLVIYKSIILMGHLDNDIYKWLTKENTLSN